MLRDWCAAPDFAKATAGKLGVDGAGDLEGFFRGERGAELGAGRGHE